MDLRVVTIDVPKQEIMTRDNVPAAVDAVVYFRVLDPQAAVVKVENFLKASSNGLDGCLSVAERALFSAGETPGFTRRPARAGSPEWQIHRPCTR
jgi:regulator of protease activity HflC (stomatin/prohibitin superfamily)